MRDTIQLDSRDRLRTPKSNNKFVAFFDILGFKNIVKDNSAVEIFNKLKVIIKSVGESVNGLWIPDKIKHICVSDSIILYSVDDSEVSCINMFAACNRIMREAFVIGLPLRGALSYGEFIVEDYVFVGQAYIDAVELEKVQKWAGCILTKSCVDIKQHYYLTPSAFDLYIHEYTDCPIYGHKEPHIALSYWASSLELTKSVTEYFPVINPLLDQNVKDDILYKQKETEKFIEYVKSRPKL